MHNFSFLGGGGCSRGGLCVERGVHPNEVPLAFFTTCRFAVILYSRFPAFSDLVFEDTAVAMLHLQCGCVCVSECECVCFSPRCYWRIPCELASKWAQRDAKLEREGRMQRGDRGIRG